MVEVAVAFSRRKGVSVLMVTALSVATVMVEVALRAPEVAVTV